MSKLIGDHIKAVVFDFDDTLVATIEAKWAAQKHVSRELFGKELSEDKLRKHWGKPMSVLFEMLYGSKDNAKKALEYDINVNNDFPKVIYDDTLEVLSSLRKSKKLVGLVTALDRKSLTKDLKIAGISKGTFDYIQAQEDSQYHKPDPKVFDPLKVWLKKKAIKPSEVMYIGDGLFDMQAAHGAGFEFIGVTTGLVTQEEFAIHNIKTMPRLKDLI